MREIKFRAWDVHFGEMVGPNYLGDHWIFECDSDGMSLVRETDDEVCANYTTVESVFMQFTGLTDKNGVEIYEGDITRHDRGYIWSVIFEDNESRFALKCKAPLIRPLFKDRALNLEVIGNIYQNPELHEK